MVLLKLMNKLRVEYQLFKSKDFILILMKLRLL